MKFIQHWMIGVIGPLGCLETTRRQIHKRVTLGKTERRSGMIGCQEVKLLRACVTKLIGSVQTRGSTRLWYWLREKSTHLTFNNAIVECYIQSYIVVHLPQELSYLFSQLGKMRTARPHILVLCRKVRTEHLISLI